MRDYVAWTMADGHTMAGRIAERIGDSVYVLRVDGTRVRLESRAIRPATFDDIESAIAFYRDIGK